MLGGERMTQSSYLLHLQATNNEPPEAAAIRQKAWWTVHWSAWMTEAEQ